MRATRIQLLMAAGLGTLLVFSHATFAETDGELKPIRDDVKKLKEQLDSFGKDLQEIKILLRQSQSPIATPTGRDVLLHVGSDRVRGDPKARITMIGFGDFECAYCESFAAKTLPELDREYIKTGKVRYAFRNYPLEALNKDALELAEAAGCAQEQGRFWELHDRFFANQKALTHVSVPEYAKAAHLDLEGFRACLAGGKEAFEVRKDIAEALRARVRGTPTFFLGLTDPHSADVKPIEVIMGAQPYLAFKMAVERLLDIKK